MDKPKMMDKCYKCKYRGAAAFSYHSSCMHPNRDECNIKINEHGKKNGWFNWPANFDPLWLENCDGFEPKKGS